ncbi:MAG: heme lyase CcmF/NrfE family subunit [Pseudomonadota bacterium]
MIVELGELCLIIALLLSLAQAGSVFIGLGNAKASLQAWSHSAILMAKPLALLVCGILFISFLCLGWAFFTNDFSVTYVAQTSNAQLPWYFRLSAIWGGHEGSLLLWVLILAGWTAAVAQFSKTLLPDFLALVLSVLHLVLVGFLFFILATSNPFDRSFVNMPLDGSDLNPLLQDFGLIVHPPMLYMGYVGFSVAFAFAIAGLIQGRLDTLWARWTRPWTQLAWIFLTIGIALGSWWAYYELGWGGWWFWDPVENASFMPWLVGTALLHSLAVTEKRGVFKSWTVLLAILAFSLSLLGTFLVRSGILTSVHSFAADPTRGVFILGLLFLSIGGSLALYAWRAHQLKVVSLYTWPSREAWLLINNVILALAALVVLIGTLFPLMSDVFEWGTFSVGEPYFNQMFVPLTLAALFFLSVAATVHWKRHRMVSLIKLALRRFVIGFLLTVLFLGIIPHFFSTWIKPDLMKLSAWISVTLALTVVVGIVEDIVQRGRVRTKKGLSFYGLPRSEWAMHTAHFGLAVMVIGVTMTSLFSVEKDLLFSQRQKIQLDFFSVRLDEVINISGKNYQSTRAKVSIQELDENKIIWLFPEKRFYPVRDSVMTEVAIDAGFFRDIYVAMGDNRGDKWTLRVHVKPFIRWIWGGALIMAFAAIIAVSDPRYYRSQYYRKASSKILLDEEKANAY